MAQPRRTPRYIPFQKPTIPEDKKKKDDKKEDTRTSKKEEEKKKKEEEKKKKEEEMRKKEEEEKRKKEEEEKKKKQGEKRKKEEEKGKKAIEDKKKSEEKGKKAIEDKKEKVEKIEKKPEKEEVSKEEVTQTCIIYTYPMEKYQICLADAEDVMVGVMLESEPSEPIRQSLIAFAQEFSLKYKKLVDDFSGKVSDFDTAKELVDKHFNLFLIKPIVLPLDPEVEKRAKLDGTESSILKIARDISKERGFFFTATLIDDVIKKMKMARDKIVKAIFSLNKKGIFTAIDIENVADFAERRKLWDQMSHIKELTTSDRNVILEDLLVSTEDSRKIFLDKIEKYPKKNLTEQITSDIEMRKKIRKERQELFSQLDGAVKMDDFTTAAQLLSKIAVLSQQLYESLVAKEFADRAKLFSQTAEEMRSRIPRLRAQRNEIINKATAMEVGGKYEQAAGLFIQAAKISEEIGEIEESKKHIESAERMKNLKELAELREALK